MKKFGIAVIGGRIRSTIIFDYLKRKTRTPSGTDMGRSSLCNYVDKDERD